MDKKSKENRRTSPRDGGVKKSPHLDGVAASKSRDCGDSLAALLFNKSGLVANAHTPTGKGKLSGTRDRRHTEARDTEKSILGVVVRETLRQCSIDVRVSRGVD